MPVCMASYMTVDYGHVNHFFRVNLCFQVIVHYQMFQGYGLFKVSACWQVYKNLSSFFSFVNFLKFFCQEEFFSQSDWISRCSRRLLHGHRLHTLFSFLLFNLIYMRISSQPSLVHCIYICACIFFWLISFIFD